MTRRTRSQLRFDVNSFGNLVVSPSVSRRCVSLQLSATGAAVARDSVGQVALPWDAYGKVRAIADGPALDGWLVTSFTRGRRGGYPFGVAIRVSGCFDVASGALHKATMPLWRRFNTEFEDIGWRAGHILPIVAADLRQCRLERDTLTALTTVLARRPGMRARLADPDRARQLALDLSSHLLARPSERVGARRDTIDTLYFLHDLGYFHTFGRPLPNESLPSVEEVVAKTHARLDASPYRRDRPISDDAIRTIVRKVYLDVEPWPFGALTS